MEHTHKVRLELTKVMTNEGWIDVKIDRVGLDTGSKIYISDSLRRIISIWFGEMVDHHGAERAGVEVKDDETWAWTFLSGKGMKDEP